MMMILFQMIMLNIFKQKNIFNFDLFIYRMINQDLKIFPSLLSKDLIPCDVGISFIAKKIF